ncbi:BSD domain-containing protein, partial [Klebsiella pneumoniae]
AELEKFGISDDLRDFVRGLTSSTFQNFPVQDDLPMSDVPTVSNVRQDLTEWQQKHASLVLTTVQEISRLRYELCPRHMKDANFWRIYFTLVSTHVSPYEKQYVEEIQLKEAEKIKDDKVNQTSIANQKSMTSTSSSAEQDLDTFLLGDLEDGDVGPDDGDEDFDDDFDKIDNSDVEDEKP